MYVHIYMYMHINIDVHVSLPLPAIPAPNLKVLLVSKSWTRPDLAGFRVPCRGSDGGSLDLPCCRLHVELGTDAEIH